LHVLGLDAGRQLGAHPVLVPGVGVDDVPLARRRAQVAPQHEQRVLLLGLLGGGRCLIDALVAGLGGRFLAGGRGHLAVGGSGLLAGSVAAVLGAGSCLVGLFRGGVGLDLGGCVRPLRGGIRPGGGREQQGVVDVLVGVILG